MKFLATLAGAAVAETVVRKGAKQATEMLGIGEGMAKQGTASSRSRTCTWNNPSRRKSCGRKKAHPLSLILPHGLIARSASRFVWTPPGSDPARQPRRVAQHRPLRRDQSRPQQALGPKSACKITRIGLVPLVRITASSRRSINASSGHAALEPFMINGTGSCSDGYGLRTVRSILGTSVIIPANAVA